MQSLFCFGLGYTAATFAATLARPQWRVSGTSRTPRGAERQFDRAHPLPRGALAGTTHLLVSIPPDEAGDPVLDLHAEDIAALPGLAWVGYLSTTGVYGDRGGDWVDEESALRPDIDRARRRAAAEAGWLALAQRGVPVQIFRLAGIYGPGRSALDTVRAGKAQRIVKPGQVFSRIHVADIAQVLAASIARPHPGRIYNVCDDDAAPPQDVIAHACALLGVAPPPEIPFEQAELSPMARSFYADSKRVRNDRIKTELGVRLLYPGFRDGLQALLG